MRPHTAVRGAAISTHIPALRGWEVFHSFVLSDKRDTEILKPIAVAFDL
jgi:hypothetical protein